MGSSRVYLAGVLGCCLGLGVGLATGWALARPRQPDVPGPVVAPTPAGRARSSVLMEFDAGRFFEQLAGAPVAKDQIESGSIIIGQPGYPDSAWAMAVWAGDPALEPELVGRLQVAVRSSLRGGVGSTRTTAGGRDVTWEPQAVVQKVTGHRQLRLSHTYYFGGPADQSGQIHAWLTVSGNGRQYSGAVRVTEFDR